METLNTKTYELFDTSDRFRDECRTEAEEKWDGNERLNLNRKNSPNSLKVTYFNDARGRNELICLILTISCIPFEEDLIDLAEYTSRRNTSVLPFDQLPTITVENMSGIVSTYGQSTAITRYVAKLGGMYPSDYEAALLQDSIVDSWKDMLDRFYATFFFYGIVEGKLKMVAHPR